MNVVPLTTRDSVVLLENPPIASVPLQLTGGSIVPSGSLKLTALTPSRRRPPAEVKPPPAYRKFACGSLLHAASPWRISSQPSVGACGCPPEVIAIAIAPQLWGSNQRDGVPRKTKASCCCTTSPATAGAVDIGALCSDLRAFARAPWIRRRKSSSRWVSLGGDVAFVLGGSTRTPPPVIRMATSSPVSGSVMTDSLP